MLKQGQAFIDDLKGEAEGVVGQINEAKEQVLGLWAELSGLLDWAKGLWASLTGQPSKQVSDVKVADTSKSTPAATPVKKAKAKKQAELSYEEYQARAVHEICEHLKVYFDAMRELKIHCRELEEESLVTEKVADSAIDRIEIQWQMRQLSTQLKEAMIYGTPKELGLGAMYEDFLIKYDEIIEAQEVAATLKARKERDKKWQRELLKHHQIDRALTAVAVVLVILWMWGVLLSLAWLGRIPAGSLLQLLS